MANYRTLVSQWVLVDKSCLHELRCIQPSLEAPFKSRLQKSITIVPDEAIQGMFGLTIQIFRDKVVSSHWQATAAVEWTIQG